MTWKDRFRYFYLKILRINDTPHRIALGISLGVFSGILPGSGPVFAIIIAFIFRANKAAALLGSIVVNTWITILLVIPSTEIGGLLFGVKWTDLQAGFQDLRQNFSWRDLFRDTVPDILLPIAVGFLVCGLIVGIITYLVSYFIIKYIKKVREERRRLKAARNNNQGDAK